MSHPQHGPPARGAAPGPGPRFGPQFGMVTEKPKHFRATLRRLLGYFRPRWSQIAAVFLMAIGSALFAIVSPKLLGNVITLLFTGVSGRLQGVPGAGIDFAAIAQILGLLALFYLLSAGFGFAQQYIMAVVAQKTVYDMRNQVSEKLGRLPLRYYDGRTHGEILSRVTNDMDNIANTLQQILGELITTVITFAGVIIMMLVISPTLALIVMITLPLSTLITAAVAKRSQTYFREQQKSLGQLNGHVEELFTGHRIVKAFGREAAAVAQFDRINGRLYEAGWRAHFVAGAIFPLMMFISNIAYVLVCVVGGIFVMRGVLPIGDIQAFIQYARQFGHPIAQLASIANIVQSTIASAERVFELLDEAEELPDPVEAAALPPPEGEVRFRDVRFRYKQDVPLLEEMNIDVKPGQVIAIVGPTGAGKTTLVNLLMRFYEISGGRITLDGRDIREVARGKLRSQFGMVLQETWLFNGTIRENIGYGRPGAADAEIVRAAAAAQADHFIRTLPEGYETLLNEEASNLSQGQRQLITIARAFLADPAILILDEATSSVDTRTELLIQKAMKELMKGRTSFVIAHRLSTIRDADLILVMNHGRVIEQGTHRELLARNGFYADLYNSQFSGAFSTGAAL
jgi:ATP-binding cassette, subfamily B, multidrug efflux pump